MRSVLATLVLAISTASLALAVEAEPDYNASGLIHYLVPGSVEETTQHLQDVLREKGFRVFEVIDHAGGAQAAGMELAPTRLILFGNPKSGTPLMQQQQTMAIDLPMKALVWEDAMGNVRVTFNDPVYLTSRHGIAAPDAVVRIRDAYGAIIDALPSGRAGQ